VAAKARIAPLLASSIVAGVAYPLLWNLQIHPAALIALKGAAVGLLALAAGRQADSPDGSLLAIVLALCASGDVLLEISFPAGAASFAAGHVAAIILYRRNRAARGRRSCERFAVPAALLAFGALGPVLLLGTDHIGLAGFTIYSLLLSAMAAAAWTSRFPRSLTGTGALLFVASDTLIAARMGPLAGSTATDYAVWLAYYAGQMLIFVGAARTLVPTPK
jgi:uncharacterized membrane protein YhhN